MQKKEIVIIFIQNSEGKYFVHQRLSTKKSFPNLFGIGAGGHKEPDEDITAAARRELQEETGLDLEVEYLFREEFDEPDESWTSYLFITQTDEHIETDPNEWQWSGWLRREEVDELYANNKLCLDTGVLYKKYLVTQSA